MAKLESGEFVPKLQASHAPPCKLWTAFAVIDGIRPVVTNIVYEGEDKLRAALAEVVGRYRPELIVFLSCCCSGIIGDDVEAVAAQAQEEPGTEWPRGRCQGHHEAMGPPKPNNDWLLTSELQSPDTGPGAMGAAVVIARTRASICLAVRVFLLAFRLRYQARSNAP